MTYKDVRMPQPVTVALGCPRCAHGTAHGWWGYLDGSKNIGAHCKDCHRNWTGTTQIHCVMCHLQFATEGAFGRHVRSQGERVWCKHPETISRLECRETTYGPVWGFSPKRPAGHNRIEEAA